MYPNQEYLMLWTWSTKFIHRKLNFSINFDHGGHGKIYIDVDYVVGRFDYVCHQHRLSPMSDKKPSTFPSMSIPSWSKPIFLKSSSVSIPRLNSRFVLNFSSSDFSILTGEERQGPGVLRILSQINGNFSSHFVNRKDGLSFQFNSLSGWVFIESIYSWSFLVCI